ncbi:MAG TPA: hypothetical protein VN310_04810, partial [Candidatus Dormibacteraeota bacterium]|nr:hypothetical protein [Candidatus Dormibacteraeota bacterium]
MRQKVRRLDSTDCAFHQVAKLLSLLVGDSGLQVLNFDEPLANEYDLGDVGNACHPGVADELRIQRQQSFRFFRVSARRRFPLQQAALSVEFADGVDV